MDDPDRSHTTGAFAGPLVPPRERWEAWQQLPPRTVAAYMEGALTRLLLSPEFDAPDDADVGSRQELGNQFVSFAARFTDPFALDADLLVRFYLAVFPSALKEREAWGGVGAVPPWAGRLSTSWQLAWLLSRAPRRTQDEALQHDRVAATPTPESAALLPSALTQLKADMAAYAAKPLPVFGGRAAPTAPRSPSMESLRGGYAASPLRAPAPRAAPAQSAEVTDDAPIVGFHPSSPAAAGPSHRSAVPSAPAPPEEVIHHVHPSIELADESPIDETPTTITISLQDAPSAHTAGGAWLPGGAAHEEHALDVRLCWGEVTARDTLRYSRAAGTLKAAVFTLTARLPWGPHNEKPDGESQRISVNFYRAGRWCGEAFRNVYVRADAGVRPKKQRVEQVPQWRAILAVQPQATPPDLLVRIQRLAEDRYRWTMLSPHADLEPEDEASAVMDLPGGGAAFVKSRFYEFLGKPLSEEQSKNVEGILEELWRSTAPKAFRDAYWRLHDLAVDPATAARFDTIQLVSDEPHVPWELMRVVDASGKRALPPALLGVRHAVGRWQADESCFLPQQIRVSQLAVFGTDYANNASVKKLPSALLERDYLNATYETVDKRPMTLAGVSALLEQPRAQAVHFAGHGKLNAQAPEKSVLYLEDDVSSCTPALIGRAETRASFGSEHPFVFLNACELGAEGFGLGAAAGWPSAFLRAGAGAYVGALWEVKDDEAHAVAKLVYRVLIDEGRTLGEALREVRAQWRARTSLTHLAYVLYGDPNGRLSGLRRKAET